MPWFFDRSLKITKQIDFQYTMRGASTFGDTYAYENRPPDKQATFYGQALTGDEVDDLEEAADIPWDQAGSDVTLDVQGVQWVGKIMSLEIKDIIGVADYYEATVTLWRPTVAVVP